MSHVDNIYDTFIVFLDILKFNSLALHLLLLNNTYWWLYFSFMLHRRKNKVLVWNNLRVNNDTGVIFGRAVPLNAVFWICASL